MKQEEKRIPSKYRGGKITSGFVLTAVTILIFVLALLLLMKFGIVNAPAFLRPVLGIGEPSEQTAEPVGNDLPDFGGAETVTEEHYYTFAADPRDILASLTETEAYTREFRVINSYDGEVDLLRYTLTVNGSRFRLVSDRKTVLCDGETICTIAETYQTTLNGTGFTLENEVGITSLTEVRTAAEKGSVTYYSSNGKMLLVLSEDAETGVLAEFLVSIETGIVMSERFYLDGELYHAVLTDTVDVFAADDLPEDFFMAE
ncbi:MAG: hypothetical protein ACI4V1_08005 [Eubacteriales bacterium]